MQSDLIDLHEKVQRLITNFERAKQEEVSALLQEVPLLTKSMFDRGSGFGEESVITVPFMPIRLPSEFQMQIQRTSEIHNYQAGSIPTSPFGEYQSSVFQVGAHQPS